MTLHCSKFLIECVTLYNVLFETFSNGNRWDVIFHKYYKPYDVVYNGVRYSNGITYQQYDADGYAIAQATGAIDAETLQKGIDMIR